jgi:hypothetical protein
VPQEQPTAETAGTAAAHLPVAWPGSTPNLRAKRRRTIAAIVAGTVIEWYDFALYDTAAGLVFAPRYFPGAGSLGRLLAAFGTFAVDLVARPHGGLISAHFGDSPSGKPQRSPRFRLSGIAVSRSPCRTGQRYRTARCWCGPAPHGLCRCA